MQRMCRVVALIGALAAHGVAEEGAVVEEHVMVYHEPGRFGGWPANHGIWSWDNEILVGFGRGYYKDLGPDRHAIDRDKPEEHLLARSLDGGATWTIEDPAAQGVLIPRGPALHGTELPGVALPELTACPGGIDFMHPDFAMTVRMSDVHGGTARFHYSYDRGRTWAGPFRLPLFDTAGIAARTDYLVDDNDTCTLFLTSAKHNGREGRPLCVRTRDGGASWDFLSWIGPEPKGFAIMPASVRLSATDIVVAVRCRERAKRSIAAYRSEDDGRTWSPLDDPVSDLGEGNPPSLIALQDGRLCLTYGYRGAPFRIAARFSRDGGRTWGDERVLRDDGASRDMGYVRSVQRPDGKVVSVYYFHDAATGPERYIAATIWDPNTP